MPSAAITLWAKSLSLAQRLVQVGNCRSMASLVMTIGWRDGIEVNILGLSFGIDFWRPALKLPLIGRLGFSERSPSFSDEAATDSDF